MHGYLLDKRGPHPYSPVLKKKCYQCSLSRDHTVKGQGYIWHMVWSNLKIIYN